MINLNKIKKSIQNKQIMIFECEMPIDILNQGFKFNSLGDLIMRYQRKEIYDTIRRR